MEKIKLFLQSDKGKDLMVIIIVILVGLASFGLGRLSVPRDGQGIKIEYPAGQISQTASTISSINLSGATHLSNISTGKNYFASSRGKKYYGIDCEAGKSIKKDNRIYFATPSEAEASGFTLSSSCK